MLLNKFATQCYAYWPPHVITDHAALHFPYYYNVNVNNMPNPQCSDAKYCNQYVCLSVCLHNSKTTQPNFTKFFCMLLKWRWIIPPLAALWCVIYFRFWGWCHVFTLMALWRIVYFYAAIEHDKHNSRDSNQILCNDKDQQVLIVHTNSAIYNCLFSKENMN